MAIIEELGLEVKVQVNGSTAAEYPDEEPDVDLDANPHSQTTKTCHHYVESVDNAEFAIESKIIPGSKIAREWIIRSQNHRLSFAVAFDGGRIAQKMLACQKQPSILLDGIYDSENQTVTKFRFAPVSTVDDVNKKRVTEDMKVAQHLGLIRVSVSRVICKGEESQRPASHPALKIGTDSLSLAEKALKGKAISHGTALSAPVQSPKHTAVHVDYVDGRNAPFAIFHFKYRSRGALQSELIIPGPRSLSVDSDLGNLSPDEIQRLARERLLQIKDGKKRALSVKDEDDAEVVRRDRPFKYVRIEGEKEAIDLTEDD